MPVFPTARISIYTGPANANWTFTRAPTAQELDVMTQGALDVKARFQTSDYQIIIDTIDAVPTEFPGDIPEGRQIIGVGFSNANTTIPYANGKIRGSRVRVAPGFTLTSVRSELTNMHAGQKSEDNANGNTFFAANRPNGITDFVPGDVDIIQNVNNKYARDAENKRLANSSASYVLRP